jgi:hypothetical protein
VSSRRDRGLHDEERNGRVEFRLRGSRPDRDVGLLAPATASTRGERRASNLRLPGAHNPAKVRGVMPGVDSLPLGAL